MKLINELFVSGSALPTYDQIDINEKEKDRSLIPFCKGLDLIPSYPSILDLNQIVFINSHLPQQYQIEWRFLFSSEIHGESFSTLIGKNKNKFLFITEIFSSSFFILL